MPKIDTIITKNALDKVDEHWAVSAIGHDLCARAIDVANVNIVRSAVGNQMKVIFKNEENDKEIVKRTALAYEIAAIEGIDAILHPSNEEVKIQLRLQAQAGAFRAYSLMRTLPIPKDNEDLIFHVLHLASLAYCGDQWTDLRRWLNDHDSDINKYIIDDEKWELRILSRLYNCWLRLLRKNGWEDLNAIREIIEQLRRDQKEYEKAALKQENDLIIKTTAFRLISLYHWAKATELLASYVIQGQPVGIEAEVDKHFESALKAASAAQDAPLDVILRWLHVTSRKMIAASLWKVAQAVNSRVSSFVKNVTRTRSMFELLPPQRAALQEQGLLDQASRAVVIDLPTSGGKTTLAQFRILQALNQFDAERGWVAYVAPTRALVNQLTRRLREDFNPLNIIVEQLTGSIEIDCFEEAMLTDQSTNVPFHILISTPEKLQLVIRNKKVSRPLALIVVDEAHNIEDEERGLRIELLLATIKRDCDKANFLLLMPDVPNAADLAQWLGADSGKTISIGTSPWQPNERIVGLFKAIEDNSVEKGWKLQFESVTTTPRSIHLKGQHQVGDANPLNIPLDKTRTLYIQTGAMAKVFSARGTSIAVARSIKDVWSMAHIVKTNLNRFEQIPAEIALVQRFLSSEISPKFELIDMLEYGVGVHHAGLSDETRNLMEWLAENGKLRVLCATTTLANGINFPVTSVFLSTRFFRYEKKMTTRAFWNLAGRAGRVNQETVGIVGLAEGKDPSANLRFISQTTGNLVSRLINLLDDVDNKGKLNDLSLIIQQDQWLDFRCYVAHLFSEKKSLDAVIADTEQLLRNTFGFGILKSQSDDQSKNKVQALLSATSEYAKKISKNPGYAALADATGFAPEGVSAAIDGLNELDRKLSLKDWEPNSLFGDRRSSHLPDLIGIMMKIPEIKQALKDIGSKGLNNKYIADVASAWVDGWSIQDIANKYFKNEGDSETKAITWACKAIYRVLTNNGPWGLSALCKISGIDFDKLSAEEKQRINLLPAMIYHGVKTEGAVLMRMNNIPRSIAEMMGEEFEKNTKLTSTNKTVGNARNFIKSLKSEDWHKFNPQIGQMSGKDYRDIWTILSGEISI